MEGILGAHCFLKTRVFHSFFCFSIHFPPPFFLPYYLQDFLPCYLLLQIHSLHCSYCLTDKIESILAKPDLNDRPTIICTLKHYLIFCGGWFMEGLKGLKKNRAHFPNVHLPLMHRPLSDYILYRRVIWMALKQCSMLPYSLPSFYIQTVSGTERKENTTCKLHFLLSLHMVAMFWWGKRRKTI